jgi:predicted outer membrane protein
MRNKNLTLVGIIVTLIFSQINNTYAEDAQQSPISPQPEISSSPISNQVTMTDDEILSIITTLDTDEIDAAKHALGKKLTKRVLDFTNIMRKHHRLNLEQTSQLQRKLKMNIIQTPAVLKLKADDADGLSNVILLNGNNFEKAFIDLMVNAHTKALNMFDYQLIPSAQDNRVKEFLNDTRKNISNHLSMATKIQAKLNK